MGRGRGGERSLKTVVYHDQNSCVIKIVILKFGYHFERSDEVDVV